MRRETRFAAGMLDALSPRLSSLASSTGLTSLECLGTPRVARTSASLESAPSVLLTPAPPLSTFRSAPRDLFMGRPRARQKVDHLSYSQGLGDGLLRRAVLRNRRGRMRGTDGSRIRRIEGQAPRAGGSSARLGTKKTLTRLRSRPRRVAPRDPQFRHRSSRAPCGGARGAAARRRRPPPSRRRRRARPLQRRRRPGRSDGE